MAASVNTPEYLHLIVGGRYIDMAAFCLVIFDCFLTLDLEIKHIWPSRLHLTKVMYFINRYTTILDCVLICVRSTVPDVTHCVALVKAEGVLYILGVYFAEYAFTMRTYVIWQKRKIVWIPLCIFYVGSFLFNFVSYYSTLNHTQYFHIAPLNGCLAGAATSDLWIDMILLIIYDTAMVILMGLATIGMWRSGTEFRPDLFRVLYGEGVLFYFYLLAFSGGSLITVKITGNNSFILLARCVRSILASRMVLHIRETTHKETTYPNSITALKNSSLL